jgi:hypothetical protein
LRAKFAIRSIANLIDQELSAIQGIAMFTLPTASWPLDVLIQRPVQKSCR